METYRSDFGRNETEFIPNGAFLRRAKRARKHLQHVQKNGIYDPITFYHVIDGLLQVKAWQPFRANELVRILQQRNSALVWDSITVGRILADIHESLEAKQPGAMRPNRRWNGMTWEVSDHTVHRQALVDLMEDLYDLAMQQVEEERRGNFAKRLDSPMLRCPSVG